MQLNYFGALRLIMGFLPKMIEQKRGHIINISSIGVLSNAPRFSAYVASKSALDSFSACAASEFLDKGINFTTINMPLVRTPMIAPTKIYENVPTLSPEEAADLVVEAIVYKPVRIATRLGIFGAVCHAVAPQAHADPAQHRVQHVPGLGGRAGQEGRGAASSSSRPSRWRSPSSRRGFTGRARAARNAPRRCANFRRRRSASHASRSPSSALCADAAQRDVLGAGRGATTVCGATIESCHDQSDTTRHAGRARLRRVELGEPRAARPHLRERRAGEQPRVHAAVVRRAERDQPRAPSRRRSGAGRRARRARPCCARRSRPARAPVRGQDRVDLRRDLVGEGLDRRERRAVGQRVDRPDALRATRSRAQPVPHARVAQHAVQQQDRQPRGRGRRIAASASR